MYRNLHQDRLAAPWQIDFPRDVLAGRNGDGDGDFRQGGSQRLVLHVQAPDLGQVVGVVHDR